MVAVVNLKLQIGAGRDPQRVSGRPYLRHVAGKVNRRHDIQITGRLPRNPATVGGCATVIKDWRKGPEMDYLTGAVVILIPASAFLNLLRRVLGIFGLINDGNRGVMHDAAVAGKDLTGLDPLVLGEIRWDVNIFVIVLGCFGHKEFRNGKDEIWFEMPALFEDGSRGQIFRIPLLRSALYPGIDS